MIDWLACGIVKSLGWLCCRLPPALCVRLGMALGWLASWLQPKRRWVGEQNLKAAFGERLSPAQRRRVVRGVFQHMVASVIEMLRLPVIDLVYVKRYVDRQRFDLIDRARQTGRPVVFLTAHVGNWELSSITGALSGIPMTVLARAQEKLPKLYRLLVSYRESKGCRVVHKGLAMKALFRALERKETVGIVGDQASRRGIFVELFGRPALFATGPFELARKTGAVMLPAFMQRVRGPYHRLTIEPPIDLAQWQGTEEEVVRYGVERFANTLARRIEADPAQWLWLHKRWKHTPARQVVVLSDGKRGHRNQSLTVSQALREEDHDVRERVVEVRYRNRLARGLAMVWTWLWPGGFGRRWWLRRVLTSESANTLLSTYADIVISCGSSMAPINVWLARENRAKSVVIMNPAPLSLGAFDLAFVPVHDGVPPRPNVVQTYGALNRPVPLDAPALRERLRAHPKFLPHAPLDGRAVIAVFLGGDTPEYRLTAAFVETLMQQVLSECEALNGACVVTSSRRTPPGVEQWLASHVAHHPRCWLLLLASRDPLDGTVDGMLSWAEVAVVTAESVSMVSEACASGRYVVTVEPPLRQAGCREPTKAARFIHALAERGYVRAHPLPELGHAIRRCVSTRPPVRRLDVYHDVQEAVKRLL